MSFIDYINDAIAIMIVKVFEYNYKGSFMAKQKKPAPPTPEPLPDPQPQPLVPGAAVNPVKHENQLQYEYMLAKIQDAKDKEALEKATPTSYPKTDPEFSAYIEGTQDAK